MTGQFSWSTHIYPQTVLWYMPSNLNNLYILPSSNDISTPWYRKRKTYKIFKDKTNTHGLIKTSLHAGSNGSLNSTYKMECEGIPGLSIFVEVEKLLYTPQNSERAILTADSYICICYLFVLWKAEFLKFHLAFSLMWIETYFISLNHRDIAGMEAESPSELN